MKETFRDDYKTYQQYLRVKDTVRRWWVEWKGPLGEHKDWFYYQSNARRHYSDVSRVGFSAMTNAQ